jgi:hypothetical protein
MGSNVAHVGAGLPPTVPEPEHAARLHPPGGGFVRWIRCEPRRQIDPAAFGKLFGMSSNK